MSTEARTTSAIIEPAVGIGSEAGTNPEADGGLRRGLSNRHIQMIALGGAIAGWLFSFYGFVSDAVVQTDTAQSGILLTGSLYAGLAFFAAAALLFLYPLTSEKTKSIAAELVQRRKSFIGKTAS